MRRRANPILTFSLCTALAVHMLGLSAMAWWWVGQMGEPYLGPINKWKVLAMVPVMAPKPTVAPIPPPKKLSVAQPKSTPPPPAPPPKPPPPPKPKPKVHELPKPDQTPPVKDDSGEEETHGTANRSTDGQTPMEALPGLEQADLMKASANDKLLIDPTALNPASAGEINGSDDPRQVASAAGVRQPDFVKQSDPTPAAESDPTLPTGGPPVKDGPGNQPPPKNPAPKENHPTATGSTDPTPNAKAVATSDNHTPPRAVRGRLANASDTDSAPLQSNGSFAFKAGRMVARNGLKVKYTQPRFGEAAMQDLASKVGSEAVFQVEVNADGSNNDVELSKSSGSNYVDEDLKLCLYASTFSPEKDKDGHPKRTVWTIHILL